MFVLTFNRFTWGRTALILEISKLVTISFYIIKESLVSVIFKNNLIVSFKTHTIYFNVLIEHDIE